MVAEATLHDPSAQLVAVTIHKHLYTDGTASGAGWGSVSLLRMLYNI